MTGNNLLFDRKWSKQHKLYYLSMWNTTNPSTVQLKSLLIKLEITILILLLFRSLLAHPKLAIKLRFRYSFRVWVWLFIANDMIILHHNLFLRLVVLRDWLLALLWFQSYKFSMIWLQVYAFDTKNICLGSPKWLLPQTTTRVWRVLPSDWKY